MNNNRRTLYVLTCVFIIGILLAILGIVRHARTTQEMQQEINKQKATIEELQATIDQWSTGYADLEGRYAALEQTNEETRAEADGYLVEIRKLKEKISEYDKQVEQKQEQVLYQAPIKAETKQSKSKQTSKAETKTQAISDTTKTVVKEEVTTAEEIVEETITEAPVIEEPTTEEVTIEETQQTSSSLTEDEIYMLAQLIYLEGGNTSYECQLAIGSVALNLARADGVSLKTEIYTPGRFSVSGRVARTTPSSTSLKAARQLATSGTTLPSNVKCFRNNHYFSWCKPYTHIDNVYFGSY